MVPNFFVAGVEKSGTTSMHRYLAAHPDVFMSRVKEPGYYLIDVANPPPIDPAWEYTRRIPRSPEAYEALFAAVTTEHAVGEASTGYFQSEWAMRRIRDEVPGARIVVLLRDPAARAHSAHVMYVENGSEPLTDLWAAIDAERAARSWRGYVRNGFYADAIARARDWFGPARVHVVLSDDFGTDPVAAMAGVYAFLGVDPAVTPPTDVRFNSGSVTKHRGVERVVAGRSGITRALKKIVPASARASVKRRAQEWNRTAPPSLTPEDRVRLIELFADDIDRTATLLDRDLSAWKRA